jgi:MFS family permease
LATVSYQFLFFIDGITCFLAAVTFIYFLGFHAPPATPSATESEHDADNNLNLAPWQNGRFILFLFLCFLAFSVFFQLISTFPIFLQAEYHLSKIQIGTLFGANTLGVVAFEMVLIQMLDRRNLMRMIAWGSLLMCLGFGLLPLGFGYWFAMATVSVWTVGEMLAMPQMLVYVTRVSNWTNRSLYMGCYTTCVAIAMMIGPLVGTYLYRWDHYNCWHFATVIGIICAVGFYLMDPPSVTSKAHVS